jgi:hypothetical protein
VAAWEAVPERLADLERQRLVTTVALGRLGRAGVGELLAAVYGSPVPFQVAEALHQRTGATRSSWRSWWSPPAGSTRLGWPPSPFPGA